MLNRFNYDSLYSKQDSLRIFPRIIPFDKGIVDSTNLVSEYSNNDKAIDLIDTGLQYLNMGVFSESAKKIDSFL